MKIDKDIETPPPTRCDKFATMEVGDSILFEGATNINDPKGPASFRHWCARNGYRYRSQKNDSGLRVWLTEKGE